MDNKSLKYKYLDPLPGNTTKRLMYEIKPGVWITRSTIPKIREKKKKISHTKQKKNKRIWRTILF